MAVVVDDSLVKEKPKKDEPSPLSMRTGDMLAQLEGASPIAASSMMRGLGDVERVRGQNERGLAMLHRQREAEVMDQRDSQSDQPKLLGRIEWARLQYPELAKKKRITQRENKLVSEGYELYFKRHFLQQKSQQAGALSQARIAALQAQTGAQRRKNQLTPVTYIGQQLNARLPIDPRAIAMWNAQYSKLPGLRSREGIATADRASREDIARETRGAAMTRSQSDRAGRMDVARLKASAPGAVKSVIQDADIAELGAAATDIGQRGFTFENWMAEYMRVAPMTSPAHRVTLKKALGRRLPSVTELHAMVIAHQGTPAQPAKMRSFLGVDRLWPDKAATPAAPPSAENFEQGWSQLDMAIEGLRLHGESEDKIARFRVAMEKELGVNGG